MEVGYMNHIDDGYKAILNKIADGLGEVSVDTGGAVSKVAQVGETVARKASDIKPTKFVRSAANTVFIVTKPFRQLLFQSHQVLQLVPLHSKFFSNPSSIVHITYLLAKQAGIEADRKSTRLNSSH